MTSPTQLSLTSWQPPQAKATAPEGVKRAAKSGRGVDAAILSWCRPRVGIEVRKADLHAGVCEAVGNPDLDPDTTRRRRDALQKMGLLVFDTIEGTARFVIREVRG